MDMVDISTAVVHNSPSDIASWPITHGIDAMSMRPLRDPLEGLSFKSSAQSAWPSFIPNGWEGSLEYTVWAGRKFDGVYHISGFIQMWASRPSTGAPILTDFAINWAYDNRWGPLHGYNPKVGDEMIFFLSAGNARGQSGVTTVRERTNVILVDLPEGDMHDWTFDHVVPPVITPIPTPDPTGLTLKDLKDQLDRMEEVMRERFTNVDYEIAAARKAVDLGVGSLLSKLGIK